MDFSPSSSAASEGRNLRHGRRRKALEIAGGEGSSAKEVLAREERAKAAIPPPRSLFRTLLLLF